MDSNQMSLLSAALQRAAATMGNANQQVANRFPQTPNDMVAAGFGAMQPPSMTPNQYVAQNFPPQMAQGGGGVPLPQPRPTQDMMAAQAPGVNTNGSITGAMGPTSVGGAPLVGQPQSAWDHYVQTGTGILPRTINLLNSLKGTSNG